MESLAVSMNDHRPGRPAPRGQRRVAVACALLTMLTACGAGAGDPAGQPSVSDPPRSTVTTLPPSTRATEAGRAATATVDVNLADYAIELSQTTVAAAAVNFAVSNRDAVPHDVVVLATDLSADALPTAGIRVDEQSGQLRVLGRSPTLPARGTASLTVPLLPGRYVLVCTVPHHYVREAMVATLTVS